MLYSDRDQPGLDPGQIYGRGVLVPPVSDCWTVGGTPDAITLRGLPGIQTASPRSSLLRVFPRGGERPNVVTGLLPEALAGPRWFGLEPGD